MTGDLYRARPSGSGRARQRHYRILPVLAAYLGCWAAMSLMTLCLVLISMRPPSAFVTLAVSYLACGWWMSRTVERHLQWNSNFAPLARAVRAKLNLTLAWPWASLKLLMQLVVMRFG